MKFFKDRFIIKESLNVNSLLKLKCEIESTAIIDAGERDRENYIGKQIQIDLERENIYLVITDVEIDRDNFTFTCDVDNQCIKSKHKLFKKLML